MAEAYSVAVDAEQDSQEVDCWLFTYKDVQILAAGRLKAGFVKC